MEKSAWQQLEEEGYDVSLLEYNLSLSPAERINNQSQAAEFISLLQSGMQKARSKHDRPIENPELTQ